MLPVAVAHFCYDDTAIRYVLPVLWMTSCFHVTAQIRMHAIGKLFTVTRQVAPGAKSAATVGQENGGLENEEHYWHYRAPTGFVRRPSHSV